jgi:hypothetical protein
LPIKEFMRTYNGKEITIMKMTRMFLTALILVGIFDLPHFSVFSAEVHSASMRVTENLRGGVVLLPPSAPETDRLTLVSFITIVPDAEVLAAIAVYDNPQTTRPMDYVEFYDGVGNLLQVSWFDQFGIRRTAVDRGLLQEEPSELEGVLTLVLEGIPV